MKVLVENATKLSKDIFEDNVIITLSIDPADGIIIGSPPIKYIMDGNACANTYTVYTDVKDVPSDWFGNKYKYDGTSWSTNSDFVDPRE